MYDTTRTNAVTPMTHLFVQTMETARTVKFNTDDNVQETCMCEFCDSHALKMMMLSSTYLPGTEDKSVPSNFLM